MEEKKNIEQKLNDLFVDKSDWKDIKDLSKESMIENQMMKQWSADGDLSHNLALKQRIWNNVIGKINKRKPLASRLIYISVGITAAIVTFVVLTFGSKLLQSDSISKMQTLLEVHTGSPMEYTLPDSSKVWMQAGAFIRFDKSFDTGRDVWTNGKTIFEVAKNEKSPFSLHLGNATIKVLGTSFSVLEMENDKNKIEVILHSGLVQFTNEISGEETLLKPHEKLVFDINSGSTTVEAYSTINWQNGRYTFTDVTIGNLAKTLNDLYKSKIVLDKGVDASHKITGSIRYDEPLDEVIHKICYSLKTYHVKKNDLIIIK